MDNKPSAGFCDARQADTLQNRIERGASLYGSSPTHHENKNPHAVALGELSSPEAGQTRRSG